MRKALIENYEEGYLSGLTENYIRVRTTGKLEEVNTIIPLQMEYTQGEEMIGKRVTFDQ